MKAKQKRFFLVRINKDPADTYASAYNVADAYELSMADEGDSAEWARVFAADAGAARIKRPRQWQAYAPQRALCSHCLGMHPVAECGWASVDAVWVNEEGKPSRRVFSICRKCLEAGSPEGPGYRAV